MSAPVSPEKDADALAAMIENLTGPLGVGAAMTRISLDVTGKVSLPAARLPLLRVVLNRALDAQPLSVRATLDGQPDLERLNFAAFSPAGTTLTLWAGGEASAPNQANFSAKHGGIPVAPAALAGWIEVALVEGNLGRLLAVLGDEKARLRRETSCLAAVRTLDHAFGDALDRIGAELAVPRLDSTLEWSAGFQEIVSTPARESDAAYRSRLKIWRPWLIPTPAAVDALIKQVDPRLSIRESNQPMAVAVRIVGSSDDATDKARLHLLARVRTDYLVFLNDAGPGAAFHAARPQPAAARAAEKALRRRLNAAFIAAPDAAVAPRLAQALDLAARVLTALGAPKLVVERAQANDAGSRYELGMGVSIKLPSVADADKLRDSLLAANRIKSPDKEVESMISQAKAAAPVAGDRSLSWLWQASGMATVHPLDQDHLYVSHSSTSGLTVDVQTSAGSMTARAVFNAPGDPGKSDALQTAIDHAAGKATPGYAPVAPADVVAALTGILDLAPGSPENQVLAAAGLPASTNGSDAANAVHRMPSDLWTIYALDAALTTKIKAGDPSSIAALSAIVSTLRDAGMVSLLPLLSASRALLVASVVSLPTAGINLGERIATGVRWIAVPLAGAAELGNATGFVTSLRLGGNSLVALIAIGYVRNNTPDPYEVRVELPEGALLELASYERLMNALERIYAIGVEVNTWDLRQRHVDLAGNRVAVPLPPRLARHYRQFRMPRMRGMEEPDANSGVPLSLQSG